MDKPPPVRGNVEVDPCGQRIVVAGDPEGFRALAKLLTWLADLDQESMSHLPEGERAHVHLYPGSQISGNSTELELCRLDAKGTGAFPRGFEATGGEAHGAGCPEWLMDNSGDL